MAEQKESAISATVVGTTAAANLLKSSKDEQKQFQNILEEIVKVALKNKDDPFDIESAIKWPKEQGLSEDKNDIKKFEIANKYFKTNGLKIDNMMYCPLDMDSWDITERTPKFSGLYPDYSIGLFCKDKNGKP
eukprot:872254_1